MKVFIVTWRIENISYSWHKTGECIVSPVFHTESLQNIAWTLKLYPRGIDNSDFLSFSVDRQRDQGPINILINFELSCISEDKSVLKSSLISDLLKISTNRGQSEFGESCFIKRYEVFERRKALYLPKDILTLQCRMWENDSDTKDIEEIFALTKLITKRVNSIQYIDSENDNENNFDIKSEVRHLTLISARVLYLGDKLDIRMNSINQEELKFATCELSFVHKATRAKLCGHFSSFFGGSQKNLRWLLYIDTKLLEENNDEDTNKFESIIEITYSTGRVKNTIERFFPSTFSESQLKYLNHIAPKFPTRNSKRFKGDLWNLYDEQDLCDVELKTQNKSFFVHKVVLCARSPVFLAMLTGEMKENIKGCIEIEDISDQALDIFIKFLYQDLFEVMDWDNAIELYYAADKYQVERLKCLCCGYLMKNVSDDNVCELLILADRHYDCELKRKLYDFVCENECRISRSSSWKKFANEHQHLAMQTMLSINENKEDYELPEMSDDDLSSIPSIKDDFRLLYQDQIASDVVIKSERSTFPAHKTILSAKSSSFREMLKDKSTDVLYLLQWEDDTISRMLSFLYTNSLEDIEWDSAMKLYQLASAHEIQRLQIKCSLFFLSSLSVSNASNLLLVASENQDSKLKAIVEDYILVHDEEIFPSDEWANFSKANFLLANETMIAKYKQAN